MFLQKILRYESARPRPREIMAALTRNFWKNAFDVMAMARAMTEKNHILITHTALIFISKKTKDIARKIEISMLQKEISGLNPLFRLHLSFLLFLFVAVF